MNLKIVLSLVLISFLRINILFATNCKETRYASLVNYVESEIIIFSNFHNFTDLYNNCFIKNLTSMTENLSHLNIFPNQELIIDKTFDLEKIFLPTQILKISDLSIANIKGIDVNMNSLSEGNFLIQLSHSSLDFYSENKQETTKCDAKNFNVNFFSSFSVLIFTKTTFQPKLCPFVFKNLACFEIRFDTIADSFLGKNLLQFAQVNVSKKYDFGNKMLRVLTLSLYYVGLSEGMMHPLVFKRMRELKIENVLTNIDTGVLDKFTSLRNLDLKLDNFRDFFHQGNRNAWLKDLNSHVIHQDFFKLFLNKTNKNQLNILRVRFQYPKKRLSFNSMYEFPNEDACLFKDFPHEQLVYAMIQPGKVLKCTCTLKWLEMYSHLYEPAINVTNDYEKNYVEEKYLLMNLKQSYMFCFNDSTECDFGKIFNICEKHEILLPPVKFSLDNDTNVYHFLKWLQFILLVVLQPIFCFLGIITNLLSMVCICNKNKKKDFADPMYSHILINAFFNIAYCLIISFKLINTCLFLNGSIFCSSLYLTNAAQYFKIIVVIYLGNVMKFCCNLSYISFTFSRFIVCANLKEKTFFKIFYNIRMKSFFCVLLILSGACNLFNMFQYKLNWIWKPAFEFPYEYRSEVFCEDSNANECRLFNGFKITIHLLNDIVFFVLVVVIDICLLKYFNKEMENKLRTQKNMSDERKSEIQKSKKNVNRMVIVNGLIYAFSHLPEFVTTLLLIGFARFLKMFCTQKLSCELANEEAQFFCLISIFAQFFIFLSFNRSFRESFHDLKERLAKKKNGPL
jgi:hypothetical protein